MASEDEKNRRKIRELGQNDLYFFEKGILGFKDLVPHVHGKICYFSQHYPGAKKGYTVPRGFYKTTTISIGDNIWRVLPERDEFKNSGVTDPWHNPNNRILIVQNIDTNAMKRVNMIKNIFEKNVLFQELYPEIIPENVNKTRWSDSAAQIRRSEVHPEATFEAAGTGTALTSRHYTIINEDDTIAARRDDMTDSEAIPTKEEMDKAIGFHRLVPTLVVNHKTSLVRVIGTRWAQGDLIGWIRENQSYPWFEMSSIGPDGNPTFPEKYDREVLSELRADLGSYIFSSQYENKPISEDKMVFRLEWLRERDREGDSDGYVFMAVDPAISKKSKSDFTVVMACKAYPNRDIEVLEYIRKHLDPTETINEIISMGLRYEGRLKNIWVEDVAYQKALKHFLDKELLDRRIYLPIRGFADYSDDSKQTMIRGIQPVAMRGNLYIRPWHKELRQELLDFPYSAHDDVSNTLAIIVRMLYYPQRVEEVKEDKDPVYTLDMALKELRQRARGRLPIPPQINLSKHQLFNMCGIKIK